MHGKGIQKDLKLESFLDTFRHTCLPKIHALGSVRFPDVYSYVYRGLEEGRTFDLLRLRSENTVLHCPSRRRESMKKVPK